MHDRNAEIKECIDWRACSYTNWYENFHKITLESICIPLPDRIVDYLRDEIIILPKECYGHEEPTTVDQSAGSSFGDDDGDDEEVIIFRIRLIRFNNPFTFIFAATRVSRVQCID